MPNGATEIVGRSRLPSVRGVVDRIGGGGTRPGYLLGQAERSCTERPVVVCDPDGLSAEEFARRYPSQAGSYRLTPGLPELDGVLADALGPDPLHARRVEMKQYVLGDPPGGPQAAFAANVARVTAAP